MIPLTIEEREAVRAYALGRAAARLCERPEDDPGYHPPIYRTSYALLLRPYMEDGSCDLVLAAARRTGEETGVALWRIGERDYRAESRLDYYYGAMGWSCDWRRPPDPPGGGWRHRVDPATGAPILPWAPLVNCRACDGTPWEWIARAAALVEPKEIPALLAAYLRHPQVELLARAGLGAQWWRPTVCGLLERNPRLRAWVAQHADELAAANLGPRDALPVAGRGGTVAEAQEAAYYRACWHGLALHGVDRREAALYCERHDITRTEYSEYLDLAVADGLDPRSRSVAFPRRRNLHAETARLREHAHQRAAARASADMRRRVAEATAALAALRLPEGWRVHVLRSQEEFAHEGAAMGNCIGSGIYSRQQAEGACVCIVIEGPNRYRADAELRAGRVAQVYGPLNSTPTEPARNIARAAARALRRAAA